MNFLLGTFVNWSAMSKIKAEIVFSLSGMHSPGLNSKTPSISFLALVISYGAQLNDQFAIFIFV